MAEKKPYKVRTTNGVLHSEYETASQAEAAAARLDKEAQALGIVTRYAAHDEV